MHDEETHEAVDLLNEEAERTGAAEERARSAESRAQARTFARLRLNVTQVTPGYVTCSLFQSDNGGTNWGAVGTGINFPDDWWRGVFGAADQGRRIEFEITGAHEVG